MDAKSGGYLSAANRHGRVLEADEKSDSQEQLVIEGGHPPLLTDPEVPNSHGPGNSSARSLITIDAPAAFNAAAPAPPSTPTISPNCP